ncbi:transcriptional antitermination N peptide [Erwinia sorbitola]|uniref:Uncharacterized protein n=1 Tax=Erwinia sorbitola TaxID=2681984 RepID=A0A6I6EET3_9GAMM|nr:hypothetical protein [Erwinia sorbitola]QGU87048.1 hypothetical protein GN242_07380 [Erwinia sorbitola]
MTVISYLPTKNNSKSRRMRERGEHYAAYKALCDADRLMARKLEAAFTKLSEGCTPKVARAINGPSVRDVKEETGAMCLPDVALYAAGHRKPAKSVTAR